MKLLIINTDYPNFLKTLNEDQVFSHAKTYAAQLKRRNQTFFGSSDFYSHHLNNIGCEAIDIHYNNISLQTKWAEENLKKFVWIWRFKKFVYNLSDNKYLKAIGSRLFPKVAFPISSFLNYILMEQIKKFEPDVILNQSPYEVPFNILHCQKNKNVLIIGQIASSLPSDIILQQYDLLISSLPNFVEKFKKLSVPSFLVKLAFDNRVIQSVGDVTRDLSVVFVGSVTGEHKTRVKLLEFLCSNIEIHIWGNLHNLLPDSPIYRCYRGEAWGLEMYQIFKKAKIVLNNHIDLSEEYANNMRLYEATGCGALLLTDHKKNIEDIFKVNQEIITYESPQDCLEKILFYLAHEDERTKIAKFGNIATLTKHGYATRMEELHNIVKNHLARQKNLETAI